MILFRAILFSFFLPVERNAIRKSVTFTALLEHLKREAGKRSVILNEAKRSEESPDSFQNIGKSNSCPYSGILQDCFYRAGALESLQRFALQAFQIQ